MLLYFQISFEQISKPTGISIYILALLLIEKVTI